MKEFDFIGKRKSGFTLSAIFVTGALLLLLVRGLNYGIDFKGGSIFHYRFHKKVTETQIRHALSAPHLKKKLGEVKVQQVIEANIDDAMGAPKKDPKAPKAGVEKAKKPTETSEYIIHTEWSSETTEEEDVEIQIDQALLGAVGKHDKLRKAQIGATIGKTLRNKAIWAIILGVLIILIYISFRFQAVFAVAAVIALVHDCLFVMGLFALFQREVNIDILAALLTILGYSLNDTIVILDRIRENLRLRRKSMSYADVVNRSINQSLSRTINTSLTTLLPVLTLLFFGGTVIRGFAMALLIGVLIGTYSSIFVVSPIVVNWYYRTHPGVAKKEKAPTTA